MKYFKKCIYILLIIISTCKITFALDPPEEVKPKHYQRFLAIANVAFIHDYVPVVSPGIIYQFSLTKSSVTNDNGVIIKPPRFYLHLLLSGGIHFNEMKFYSLGQVGILYRISSTISTAGIALQYVYPTHHVGPVARIEIMDNIGVQSGWLFPTKKEEEGKFFISVDYMFGLFEDLGL